MIINTEKDDENLYEEIVPKDRKVGRSKSLIFPARHRKREHLEVPDCSMMEQVLIESKLRKNPNYIHIFRITI